MNFEDRRKGLYFATVLHQLAPIAPDESDIRLLNKVVNRLQRKYGYSVEEKKSFIIKVVRDLGGISIADLINKTGWREVYDLTKQLEQEQAIEFRRIPPAGGGAGRPSILIVLAETRNFSPPKTITAKQAA